jgi:hypothetical protein
VKAPEEAGSLDHIKVGTEFTAVGYGAQSVTIDHGPTFHYADVRYVASGGLEPLNKSWLAQRSALASSPSRASTTAVGSTSG